APTEPATDSDTLYGEEAFDATPADEHLFPPVERSDIHQILTGFGLQRKLMVGAAIVATLAVGVLVYFLWPAAGGQKATETAAASPTVQSEPVAPGQTAPRISEAFLSAPTAVAAPDLPSSDITASAGSAEARPAPATQNREIVFLQRPGVNIRSTPAT